MFYLLVPVDKQMYRTAALILSYLSKTWKQPRRRTVKAAYSKCARDLSRWPVHGSNIFFPEGEVNEY